MADPDDLSHTATEHARGKRASEEASAETLPATPDAKRDSKAKVLPATIGKYRIERELGEGGMGVVYVAFDPDLERRIALKVLRAATSTEAAQRLQREARAMARLKHGNVVTVHEVATAAGRDYVAMELVEGGSLAEWLKAAKRTHAEIVDAFVQAGHGLAAAHAAGIVHRDFKPHNVLRDRAGHVSVTDFGLAREASIESDPLAVTMPLAADAATSGASKSSSLAGLTVTGALLGTPAYMAPEQWTGGAVTAATDQFAYCVALWEAVTGARPFTGPTVDMLRAQILEGSSELDATPVPKELRAPLMRGLETDPKKRWPSMDALLAAIAPRNASPWFPVRALMAAGALVIATLILITMRQHPPTAAASACRLPAMALADAWSPAKKQALVEAHRTLAVLQLDADATAWSAARDKACAAAPDVRAAMLDCLDGVMGRFDTAVAAVTASTEDRQLDAGDVLVDPVLCTGAHPPHLTIPSPELRVALAEELEDASHVKDTSAIATRIAQQEHLVGAPALAMQKDPCAAMYNHARLAVNETNAAKRRPDTDLAEQGLDRCTDDRARADGALFLLALQMRDEFVAASVEKKLRQAEIAIEPVSQSDVHAHLAAVRATMAMRTEDVPRALQAFDEAATDLAKRSRVYSEIDIGRYSVLLHQLGATDADFAEVKRRFTTLHARASTMLGPDSDAVRQLDQLEAYWAFAEGDVTGSHARLVALQKLEKIDEPMEAHGIVVDEKGDPVAGALVAAGHFSGDEISIVLPDPTNAPYIRTTTTAADGSFSFPEALRDSVVVAQLGDRRSLPVHIHATMALPLRPTSQISGKVDLRGLPAPSVLVIFTGDKDHTAYGTVAPVAADGSFHIAGVAYGKIAVEVAVNGLLGRTQSTSTLDVDRAVITGLQLEVPSPRIVYVVLRSQVAQPIANSEVFVLKSAITATTLAGLNEHSDMTGFRLALPAQGDSVPPEVKAVARDGDLYVRITGAPPNGTACAIPLPGDISDKKLHDLLAQYATKVPLACKAIPPDAKVIIDEVPPWPRLD